MILGSKRPITESDDDDIPAAPELLDVGESESGDEALPSAASRPGSRSSSPILRGDPRKAFRLMGSSVPLYQRIQAQHDPFAKFCIAFSQNFNLAIAGELAKSAKKGRYSTFLDICNSWATSECWDREVFVQYLSHIVTATMSSDAAISDREFLQNLLDSITKPNSPTAGPLNAEIFWLLFLNIRHTAATIRTLWQAVAADQRKRVSDIIVISPSTSLSCLEFTLSRIICNLLTRSGNQWQLNWIKNNICSQHCNRVGDSHPIHVRQLFEWANGHHLSLPVHSIPAVASAGASEHSDSKGPEESAIPVPGFHPVSVDPATADLFSMSAYYPPSGMPAVSDAEMESKHDHGEDGEAVIPGAPYIDPGDMEADGDEEEDADNEEGDEEEGDEEEGDEEEAPEESDVQEDVKEKFLVVYNEWSELNTKAFVSQLCMDMATMWMKSIDWFEIKTVTEYAATGGKDTENVGCVLFYPLSSKSDKWNNPEIILNGAKSIADKNPAKPHLGSRLPLVVCVIDNKDKLTKLPDHPTFDRADDKKTLEAHNASGIVWTMTEVGEAAKKTNKSIWVGPQVVIGEDPDKAVPAYETTLRAAVLLRDRVLDPDSKF